MCLRVSRSCLWLCRADWSTSVLYWSSKPDVCLLFRCRRRIQICSTPYRGRTALWGSSWPRKFASCPRKDTWSCTTSPRTAWPTRWPASPRRPWRNPGTISWKAWCTLGIRRWWWPAWWPTTWRRPRCVVLIRDPREQRVHGKYATFTPLWFNVGPPSGTVAQR